MTPLKSEEPVNGGIGHETFTSEARALLFTKRLRLPGTIANR
jgi:hypothetical protein